MTLSSASAGRGSFDGRVDPFAWVDRPPEADKVNLLLSCSGYADSLLKAAQERHKHVRNDLFVARR
jgi:hypothetical protein